MTPTPKLSGMFVGGPMDGQRAVEDSATIRIAVHHEKPPTMVSLVTDMQRPPQITDFVYEHDAIYVRSEDGALVEFGIWRPRNEKIEMAVLRLFDFYTERKQAQAKKVGG